MFSLSFFSFLYLLFFSTFSLSLCQAAHEFISETILFINKLLYFQTSESYISIYKYM